MYLALSYCPHTLHNVIEHNLNVVSFDFRKKRNEPYPVLDADIMRIVRELVAGVAHLHMLNIGIFSMFSLSLIFLFCFFIFCSSDAFSPLIVHRDIKPQNTLLDPANRYECKRRVGEGVGVQELIASTK